MRSPPRESPSSPSPPSSDVRWTSLLLVALLSPLVAPCEAIASGGPGGEQRPASGQVRLEVQGSVQPTTDALEVRLTFANRGDAGATGVDVEGELLGHRVRGRLVAIPAGEERVLLFRYPAEVPRPGVHALTLLTDYAGVQGARNSQCLFLLLALGATAEPPVSVAVAETRLDSYDSLVARVKSADAQAHRVRLRVVTPRGLRAGDPIRLDVPPSGEVTASMPLLRAGAPRDSRQGVLVIAEDEGGQPARAAVVTAVVHVLPDPAWMPRLRWPLLALAVVLLLAAFVSEVRAGRRSPS